MNEVLKYEPNFSESKFKTYVDNIFIQVYLSVVTDTLDNVKHFMSAEVYDIFKHKIDDLKSKGLRQMYDEINVKETNIVGYEIMDNKIVIKVNLVSRYLDYLIDSNGDYVSGNRSSRVQINNHLVFTKLINSKENNRKCPTCGANIDVNANGICQYCRGTYNLEEKDFILESIN